MDDSVHTASIIDAPTARIANPAIQLVPAGVAVLLNANAKRVDRPLVRALERRLSPSDIYLSKDLEEARDHVRTIQRRGYSTLLIGGGDGTIASTLRLLREQPGPWPDLVILRLGTGNALGSLVDAKNALEDVDRVLSRGTAVPTPLRVLETDEGDVFPFASLGYDAQVLNDYVDVVQSTQHPLARRLAKSLGGYVYAVATRTLASEIRRQPTR
ncbi:MAG: diacylglycerol kinase family protein, partial [Myxococcota bacterium]